MQKITSYDAELLVKKLRLKDVKPAKVLFNMIFDQDILYENNPSFISVFEIKLNKFDKKEFKLFHDKFKDFKDELAIYKKYA